MRLLIVLAVVGLAAAAKHYEGYKLIDIMPTTKVQVEFLRSMMSDDRLDFWEEPHGVNKRVRVMADGDYLRDVVLRALPHVGLTHTVSDENVQASVDAEMEGILKRKAASPRAFDINDFNTLADTNAWLADQASSCATGLTCSFTSIGKSFENRDIMLFSMSGGAGRSAYYVDSLTHAREWLSSATVMKVMDYMLSGYGSDPEVNAMLAYDWYFVVVVNPDGYEYSWTNERLWRKNRNDQVGLCVGVDLNRNFDFRWGEEGTSNSPCSDVYCGPSGSSESETQTVSGFIGSHVSTLNAIVTIHSYGYYWLFPWGNTVGYTGGEPDNCDKSSDYNELQRVADAACNAIYATSGTTWACGTSCEEIYASTGATDDWSKGVAGIPYTYNPELRGNSFIVSPDQIDPSFQEIWAALVAMVNAIQG